MRSRDFRQFTRPIPANIYFTEDNIVEEDDLMNHVFRSFAILLLLLSGIESAVAATTKRIRTWYSPPLYYETMPSGSQNARPEILRVPVVHTSGPTQGYYLDVDTSTDGTHQVFLVTTTADTGQGSLLWAIQNANANPGLDYIHFSIGSGPQTLTPHFPVGLPVLTSPVVIDATTQPGYQGSPLIELDGTYLGTLSPGLALTAGNSTIRGLVINRCQGYGVIIGSGGGNIVQDCFIGTNLAGTDSLPNLGYGVHILNSPNNLIGDSLGTHRNVISGNFYPQVRIEGIASTGNMVMGNIIGLDKTGMVDISGYTNGIFINLGSSNNIIGGTNGTAGNLISGNDYPNVALNGDGTSNNIIKGNRIGMNWTGFGTFINGNGIYILNGSSNNIIGDTALTGRNLITCTSSYYPGLMFQDSTTTNNLVIGNVIGAPPNRDYSFGNYDGILLLNSPNNTIGGTTPGARNLIAGNLRNGISIRGHLASGNRIIGNSIGAPFEPPATQLIGNGGSGVNIDNSPNNFIGGPGNGEGNSISDNRAFGVIIQGDSATGNLIRGNLIGDDGSGVAVNDRRGNWNHGVKLIASQNSIGGSSLVDGNTIAFNGGIGVFDSVGVKNLISHNYIYSNDSMGIDLAPRGLTPNDSLDLDSGPNNLQNFPILDSARVLPGAVKVAGRLLSTPNTTFTVEFYKNTARDRSYFGEGEKWIGETTVTTNADGHATIDEILTFNTLSSEFITATATDPEGNTSEFSRAVCMLDTDGDGILDCWEMEGIDVNGDGIIDLDLYAKGARPDHKDIFVEVDHMVSRQPSATALASVEAAFASVPPALVNNPDGGGGINLHLETTGADEIQLAPWAADPWPQFRTIKTGNFGTLSERTDPNSVNILEAKRLVYRYCVFADRFPYGNMFPSGLARGIPTNDFMVTLGAFNPPGGSVQQQAGTFMHELGHTLGLSHGGSDDLNFKPNYYSVMNYMWQLPQTIQAPGTWKLNYSVAQLPNLVESMLIDSLGLNPPPGVFPVVKVPYTRPNGSIAFTRLKPATRTDWNGNGDSSGVSNVDINHFFPNQLGPTPNETLQGFADWSNLKYNFRNYPGFPRPELIDSTLIEMTPELFAYLDSLPPYGIESPLVYWSSDPYANIQVCTAPRDQSGPRAVSDGDGGAYVTWTDNRLVTPPLGTIPACMVQRIDNAGAVQWMNNGLKIAPSSDPQAPRNIMPDGNGNAIVAFLSVQTVNPSQMRDELFVQKLNNFGQAQWGSQGVSITMVLRSPAVVGIGNVEMTSDGAGGTIFVWADNRFGTYALFAQRVDASGTFRWDQGGILITTSPFNYFEFKLVSDGQGGAIVVWTDTRNGSSNYDIYAQRISASGNLLWPTNGNVICNSSGSQGAPALVGNGVGGATIVWFNYASGTNVYAQTVDSLGQSLWTTNGVQLTSVTGFKEYLGIVSDGSDGAIFSWLDHRRISTGGDVYAQRVNANGASVWTTNGVALSNSDTNWCIRPVIVSDGHQGAIVAFTRVSVANQYHIFSQRVDSTGAVRWAVNGVPVSLVDAPKDNATAASDLNDGVIVAWEDRRPQPQGGNWYHIYAQNLTGQGVLGGGGTTGIAETRRTNLPLRATLQQNYPNPFNPITTIRFELPKASRVSLKVYDILGREVATLLDGFSEAGEKSVEFRASNFATGVYFYRLVAGEFVETKKLMLLK